VELIRKKAIPIVSHPQKLAQCLWVLIIQAEFTIIEAMGPKEFLEKHDLKKIGKFGKL
jgi:hypothetical protein